MIERLRYLIDAYRLKQRPRTGWRLRGIAEPESVADHSWGTALLCLLFADDAGVDRGLALEIAVVHDLAEAEIGDLPNLPESAGRPAGSDRKTRLEAAAMAALRDLWPAAQADRVLARWRAYEDRESDEARFVRDMNLVDMALQASIYLAAERAPARTAMEEFLASAEARVETAFGRTLLADVVAAVRRAADGDEPRA